MILSSSSNTVSTISAACGSFSRSRPIASIPSIPGSRTSISTTLGSTPSSASASSAVPKLPGHSNLPVRSSPRARLFRKVSLSSISQIVTGSTATVGCSIVVIFKAPQPVSPATGNREH